MNSMGPSLVHREITTSFFGYAYICLLASAYSCLFSWMNYLCTQDRNVYEEPADYHLLSLINLACLVLYRSVWSDACWITNPGP